MIVVDNLESGNKLLRCSSYFGMVCPNMDIEAWRFVLIIRWSSSLSNNLINQIREKKMG